METASTVKPLARAADRRVANEIVDRSEVDVIAHLPPHSNQQHPLRRRTGGTLRSIAGAMVAMALVAAGCATGDGATGEGDAAEQVLVIGAAEDTTEVKPPPEANVAMGYGDANAPVFEPLVRMAPDFTIQPLLATSWDFRPPSTWRFHLREGVTFHNGVPFNAEAVAYTVNELWANQDSNILRVGTNSAEVVDEYTVDITTEQPNYRLVEQLVHPSNAIVAPGTYAGPGTTQEDTPTGTGPFKFVSYDQSKELMVERFGNYWGKKPTIDQIVFRFIPDDNSRVLALQAGEVHAIYNVPREQATQLDQDPDVRVVRSRPGAYDALLLNSHGQPPNDILRDRTVRQALVHAVDKKTIVENVWQGNAEVMQTVIPAPVLGQYADLVKGYPYDPDRARALLEQAGWRPGPDGVRMKDGRRLELTMVVVGPELQRPMPELVKAQLKEVGINLEVVVPGDSNIYYERLAAGEGDIFAEVGNQNDANPIFLGAIFTGVQPGGFSDYGKFFGPHGEYDSRFAEAFSTADTEQVRRLAAEAMHIAVDEYVATIPVAGIYRIWGLSERVEGFTPHPSETNQTWQRVRLSAEN